MAKRPGILIAKERVSGQHHPRESRAVLLDALTLIQRRGLIGAPESLKNPDGAIQDSENI
jgi:hypothetical protein